MIPLRHYFFFLAAAGRKSGAGPSSYLTQGLEAAALSEDVASALLCFEHVDVSAPWCEIAGQLGAHWTVCEAVWTALIDYSIDKPYFEHIILYHIAIQMRNFC